MRKIFLTLAICLLIVNSNAFGEVGHKIGTVEYVRTHDQTIAGWQSPNFWFTLNGITSAGSCARVNGNGTVMFVGDSKSAMAMVIAAYMTNKSIQVTYDDQILVNGLCLARFITYGDPPPGF